jgi:hypothetical protein
MTVSTMYLVSLCCVSRLLKCYAECRYADCRGAFDTPIHFHPSLMFLGKAGVYQCSTLWDFILLVSFWHCLQILYQGRSGKHSN